MSYLLGDGVGDKCQDDYDGDGVVDTEDECPDNKLISKTDFRTGKVVILAADDQKSHKPPHWVFRDQVGIPPSFFFFFF